MNLARPHGVGRVASAVSPRLASAVLLALTLAAAALLSAVPTFFAGPAVAADEPERVRVETTLGDIVLELDVARAPESVANFLDYVDAGFYDGTIFHRVIEGFMIQGGGFDESFTRRETRAPIRNEANNGLSNRRYTIAMARTNAPHSATAQFFINTEDNDNLDHTGANPRGWGYAVFGRVVDGHDVVDRISLVPTGAGGPFARDAPREPVVIESVARVEPVVDPAVEPGVDDAEPAGAGGEAPASALPVDGETTSAARDVLSDDGAVSPETAPASSLALEGG